MKQTYKKLIMMIGIPGSGKTTMANKMVADSNGSAMRVNRDDIRIDLFGDNYKYTKARERAVTDYQNELIDVALNTEGINSVIIDDTNLNYNNYLRFKTIADSYNIPLETEWLEDSLNIGLCHKRNQERARTVPYDVIENMYAKYIKLVLDRDGKPFPLVNHEKEIAYLFDIDGTLADSKGIRSPYEWKLVGKDLPRWNVINFLQSLPCEANVIIMSGRDGVCRPESEEWLWRHGIEYNHLFMRTAGSIEKDYKVKQELYENYVFPNYNVKLVLDDRDQVVKMWRALGLECWQVQPGGF